jgi:hypothetical protein
LDTQRLIIDVERPTKTRWGDLAWKLSKEDPPTMGFEFHSLPLERDDAICDPRNCKADFHRPFLWAPRDPIPIFLQEMKIWLFSESGDKKCGLSRSIRPP